MPNCTQPPLPTSEFCDAIHCRCLVTGDACPTLEPELFAPPPIRGIDPATPAPALNGSPGRTRPMPQPYARP